jgi:hypothetical protein
MAQAVSRRRLNAEARVCAWVSQRGTCVAQRGTETGFSPSSSNFPVVIPSWLSTFVSSGG